MAGIVLQVGDELLLSSDGGVVEIVDAAEHGSEQLVGFWVGRRAVESAKASIRDAGSQVLLTRRGRTLSAQSTQLSIAISGSKDTLPLLGSLLLGE